MVVHRQISLTYVFSFKYSDLIFIWNVNKRKFFVRLFDRRRRNYYHCVINTLLKSIYWKVVKIDRDDEIISQNVSVMTLCIKSWLDMLEVTSDWHLFKSYVRKLFHEVFRWKGIFVFRNWLIFVPFPFFYWKIYK